MYDETNVDIASQAAGVEFRCPHCKKTVEVNDHLLGQTVDCPNPECGQPFTATPPPGEPILQAAGARHRADYQIGAVTKDNEEVLEQVHPAIWRSRPLRFLGLSLLLMVGIAFAVMGFLLSASLWGMDYGIFGIIGLVIAIACGLPLFIWWLSARFVTLTVTTERTIYRFGIISRESNEVRHEDVRNLRIDQNAFERIMRIGDIGISSAGQEDIEIKARRIPHPNKIADLIRELQ